MNDIVELLKMAARNGNALAGEAADEIERLRGVEQDAAEWVEEQTKRLRANIERLTNNPADYRYWEGRYRDEAADNERLRAALRDIEADLREQASGSQDGYLLDVANRMRAALEAKDD